MIKMGTNEEIKNKYNIKEKQDLITLKDLEEIIGDEGFDGLIEDWNNQIGLLDKEIDKIYEEMLEKCREQGAGNDMQIFNYCKPIFINALAKSHIKGYDKGYNDAVRIDVENNRIETDRINAEIKNILKNKK